MPSFAIQGDDFVLDGRPVRILSGAVHYFRVPRPSWDDRLYKARAMGLNTVETYAPWNLHEPRPGEFHFEDNLDPAAFIEAAARHDLMVIFRPGPYICSEWDFGGLPAWLLKDPAMQVRCSYPPYLQAAVRYLQAILPRVAPLQVTRGGPLILVQVENEYGSYGDDRGYLSALAEAVRASGIQVPLFTSDGRLGQALANGSLAGAHATVNFGYGQRRSFRALRAFQPRGPLMCTEFWDGWFDHWGELHHRRPAFETAATYADILRLGASVNLYMWHGGTNFGFLNGANTFFDRYQPDVTSYDYDAPLSEAGDPTRKYFALRKVIGRYAPLPDLPLPKPAPKLDLGPVALTEAVPLWESLARLSRPVELPAPVSMEALGQDYGYILYRSQLRGPRAGRLAIQGLRDRAQVFLDGEPLGVLNRNRPGRRLPLRVPAGGARLDLLVENQGRVNFGPHLMDRKGILGGVLIGAEYVFGWQAWPLPLADLARLRFAPASAPLPGPAFYRGAFRVERPLDTFLALPGWTKGVAWVNGFHLGRYWRIGPQRTLYVPAPVLKAGENELVLFEEHTARRLLARFQSRPRH